MSNILTSPSRNWARASNSLFPAVDFELFRCGAEAEVSKASRLLRTYGAFRIKNHGLSPRTTADCFQYARKLFNGPAELKTGISLFSRLDTEKIRNKSIPKESVEFSYKSNAAISKYSPSGPPLSMCKELSIILPELLENVSKALQLDFSLNEYREDYEDNLCLHHYPVTQRAERNPAHKDFGILTLLVQEDTAGSNGLEVADLTSTDARTSEAIDESAQFVSVYPEANEITVLAGVSLQKLAGMAAIAPSVHRVVTTLSINNKHGACFPRYSIAYFVHPDAKAKLDIRGETARDYLRRRREVSQIPS